MGKGKLEKFAKLSSYDHVFECTFGDMEISTFELEGKWCKDFFKNDNPIVLELGCGKGEYAVALGKHYPNKNFIGVDIKGARLFTGARQALEQGLNNVAFIRTRIEMIDYFFAANEVDEIWITFPDPQMRKATKRLTSTYFIKRYNKFLKEGGLIHLKTDSDFLYTYTDIMVRDNNFEVLENSSDIYAQEDVSELLQIKTHYELQWLGRGKLIKYLAFRPHRNVFVEPEVEIEPDDYRSYGRDRREQVVNALKENENI